LRESLTCVLLSKDSSNGIRHENKIKINQNLLHIKGQYQSFHVSNTSLELTENKSVSAYKTKLLAPGNSLNVP